MYERIINIVGGFAIASVLALVGLNAFMDPLEASRAEFQRQRDFVVLEDRASIGTERPFAEWAAKVDARPGLWNELVPEPPPPPPSPPAPKPCPDIKELLAGIQATRQGIGDAVKLITPDLPRGDFFRVGDAINGCEITAIDRRAVTFQYQCKTQPQMLTYAMPRE